MPDNHPSPLTALKFLRSVTRLRLNRWEIALMHRRPLTAPVYVVTSLVAVGWSVMAWRPGGPGSAPGTSRDATLNARRHQLWAATLTWSLGEPIARQYLTAHEGDSRGGDHQRDLINNDIGIALGLTVRHSAPRRPTSWLLLPRLVHRTIHVEGRAPERTPEPREPEV